MFGCSGSIGKMKGRGIEVIDCVHKLCNLYDNWFLKELLVGFFNLVLSLKNWVVVIACEFSLNREFQWVLLVILFTCLFWSLGCG